MKQFIYLDTDMVNSIIAQKDKGLVLETASEHEDTTGKERTTTGVLSANGSASGGIWKFAQAQADLSGSFELTGNKHSQTVLKEIATKTLHDAAFDIAYSHITSEYDTKQEDATLGSFIELCQEFEFVDLTYIEGLLAKEGLISFLKKTEAEEIKNAIETECAILNRDQKRKSDQEIRKEVQRLVAENNKKYDDIVEIVHAIRHMIPYDRMLVASNGFLIPLEDKYFRDNPETMAFKHGGIITCVGYISNIVGESRSPNSENVFSQLQTIVNQSLVTMLTMHEKDLYVVHPIAVYYGK